MGINQADREDSSKALPNCFIKITSLQACDSNAAKNKRKSTKRTHLQLQLSHSKRTSSEKLQFLKSLIHFLSLRHLRGRSIK